VAVRKLVLIDEEKCDGCGLCVEACAEGAIQVIAGKARLVSETYCDGLGACIGDCPQRAITVVEREAAPFNEKAVKQRLHSPQKPQERAAEDVVINRGCPGAALRTLRDQPAAYGNVSLPQVSALGHWPVQLMLIPPTAPFLRGADILVCADCVPFVVPDFHSKYLAGKAVLVGCPKLDNLSLYRDKLKDIFRTADPRSITVLKMEVPCCTGIAVAAIEAREFALPHLPITVETIGIRSSSKCEEFPGVVIITDTLKQSK
jgi:ferredoxin